MQRRMHFPDDLMQAITAYAEAIVRGDLEAGSRLVTDTPKAQESHSATFRQAARQGPWRGFELIARARLGYQYIAKVRFKGNGSDLILQCRWRQEDRFWRIAEIAEIGSRSPWLKPDAPKASVESTDA